MFRTINYVYQIVCVFSRVKSEKGIYFGECPYLLFGVTIESLSLILCFLYCFTIISGFLALLAFPLDLGVSALPEMLFQKSKSKQSGLPQLLAGHRIERYPVLS